MKTFFEKPKCSDLFLFQSKHPHIIYESIEKPHQHCGVLDNQLRSTGTRSRREAHQEHAHDQDEVIFSGLKRFELFWQVSVGGGAKA